MNYEKTINTFDKKISEYVEALVNDLGEIRFDAEQSIKFTLSQEMIQESFIANKKQKGVYLFELNLESELLNGSKRFTKIKNFANEWSKKNQNSFFSSSVIKKRLEAKVNFNEQWLPLYIGKSKDIDKRIKEHIHLSPNKNTYSMKLKHRTNLEGLEFRVSIIEINVENYDFIVPHIERILRDVYCPIIGKQ